jgi:hypothetical protein
MSATTVEQNETALVRRFLDAIVDLASEPTAPNVARYLRASSQLERWEEGNVPVMQENPSDTRHVREDRRP